MTKYPLIVARRNFPYELAFFFRKDDYVYLPARCMLLVLDKDHVLTARTDLLSEFQPFVSSIDQPRDK